MSRVEAPFTGEQEPRELSLKNSIPLKLKRLVKGTLRTSGAGTHFASGSRELQGYMIETTGEGPFASQSLHDTETPPEIAAWLDELLEGTTPTAPFELSGITYTDGRYNFGALAVHNPQTDTYYALQTFGGAFPISVERQRDFPPSIWQRLTRLF